MTEVFFSDLSLVGQAQAALVATLAAAGIEPPFAPLDDQQLLVTDQAEVLNVVKSVRPPEILSEMMGLGEELSEVEWVQTYIVEWIVKGPDRFARRTRFELGIAAIAATLKADNTLGGNVRGLTIGPPDYAGHTYASTPLTEAVAIPVRIVLRGPTMLS